MSKRNDGEAGADIATLRGSHGSDFEGNATINRGGGIGLSCGCFGGDDKSEKIILIKGAYCFVFADESDQAPKYAIALAHMKAKIQAPSHGVHHVTIEGSLGDVEWELGFADTETAKKFADAFRKQAAIGEADKVREVSTVISIRPFCLNPYCANRISSFSCLFRLFPRFQPYSASDTEN